MTIYAITCDDAQQLMTALTFAEVDATYDAQTRAMMRDERIALSVAMRGGDRRKIAAAMTEAQRVATMWGVEITAR